MMEIAVIGNARAHRRVENAAQKAQVAEFVADGWTIIDATPLGEDEWWCDRCYAAIDPDGPVILAASDALCDRCAAPVIRQSDLVRFGTEYLVPSCRCEGCAPQDGD